MFWDSWFQKEVVVEKFIGIDELRNILVGTGCSIFKLDILDTKFILPTDEQVKNIVWESNIRKKIYEKGKFECEEFAFLQLSHFLGKGYVFGCAHVSVESMSTSHMVNIYVNDSKCIKYIEPQTGLELDKKVLKVYRITIV